jgi:hypothetical protein
MFLNIYISIKYVTILYNHIVHCVLLIIATNRNLSTVIN